MGFLSGVLGAATGFLTGGPAGAVIGGTVFKAWDQYKNKPAQTTVGTGVWM